MALGHGTRSWELWGWWWNCATCPVAMWGLALGWPASICPVSKPTYEQCGFQVSTSFSLSFSFLEGLGEGQESTELLEKPKYREGHGPGLYPWLSHCLGVPCLLILCPFILRRPRCYGQSWPFALNMVCQGKHSPGAQKRPVLNAPHGTLLCLAEVIRTLGSSLPLASLPFSPFFLSLFYLNKCLAIFLSSLLFEYIW